jgi:hypothetical protein
MMEGAVSKFWLTVVLTLVAFALTTGPSAQLRAHSSAELPKAPAVALADHRIEVLSRAAARATKPNRTTRHLLGVMRLFRQHAQDPDLSRRVRALVRPYEDLRLALQQRRSAALASLLPALSESLR